MTRESSIRRYRRCYAGLLRLYPRPYRKRFGEGMEQTFGDLLWEHAEAKRSELFGFALWLFVEAFAGIVRENMRVTMQNITAYRLAVGVGFTAAFLLVWFYGAVAEAGDSPGPVFLGPVAVLIAGAFITRCRALGMIYALSATALAQALVALIEMVAWGQYVELSILNGCLVAVWFGSATLFRRASASGPGAKAAA